LLGTLVPAAPSRAARAPSSIKTPTSATPPNILLLVSDDQTFPMFTRSLMPNVFSQLVDKGVTFNRAYVNTSLCCPSRSQILTGLYGQHTGIDHVVVGLTRPTIAPALHDLGYRTMLAGKYLNSMGCDPQPGWDQFICYSVPPSNYSLVNPLIDVNGTWTQYSGYTTDITAQDVADFITSTPADQPFFAMYTPTSPHLPANDPRCQNNPVTPARPPSFDEDTMNDGKPAYMQFRPLSAATIALDDSQHQKMVQAVQCLDNSMGIILNSLGAREQNTLVIFLSDNGYLFGEHRWQGKIVPHEESVRVPMVIRYPPLVPEDQPVSTDALVQNVDIVPTIADLVGIPWGADGRSLVPLLDGQATSVRDAALIEWCEGASYPCPYYPADPPPIPSWWGLVTQQYKYVEYLTGERELYDLSQDPYELHNLAGDPLYAGVVNQLSAQLAALRAPPPTDTTIVSGPSGRISSRVVTFTYFSQSRQATYQCRLDVGGNVGTWTPCNGQSTTIGSLADGQYTFEVAGTDENGVTDPTPATRTFQVTSTGPDVSIDSAPPSAQHDRNAAFTFSSLTLGVSFQCSLVQLGAPESWQACDPSSGASYGPLDDGTYSFEVRATDLTGATTDPPAESLFAVDNTGPTMVFDMDPLFRRPLSTVKSTTAKFAFHPNEPTTQQFTCQLNGGAPTDCSSGGIQLTDLPQGANTLAVTATDELGNVGTTTYSWNVDSMPPQISITSAPRPTTNQTTATFSLSVNEPATLKCSLDGAIPVVCGTTVSYSGLSDGTHNFSVFGKDQVGNVSGKVTRTWTVDTTVPTVTISSGPASGTNQTSASFTFAPSEPATLSCALDAAPFNVCKSPRSVSGLSNGPHRFFMYGTDPAGNRSAMAEWDWTVDTVPPAVTITSGPANPTNQTSATFSFSTEAGATLACSLDGVAAQPCASGVTYSGLSPGAHALSVWATDTAGNTSAPRTRSWNIDTTPPVVTISGPSSPTNQTASSITLSSSELATLWCSLDGAWYATCKSPRSVSGLTDGAHNLSVYGVDPARNRSETIVWSWTVDTVPPAVTITSGPASPTNQTAASFTFSTESGATVTCSWDGAAAQPCTSGASSSGLADGNHVLSVQATDQAGNTSAPVTWNWTVDTVPPSVTIDSGPTGPTNDTTATFAFSSEAGAVFACSLDGASPEPCSSPASYGGLADGSHSFAVTATDAAGNSSSPETATWSVDTSAPAVIIDSGPANPTLDPTGTFTFSTESNTSVTCSLDGATPQPCASGVSYAGLPPGDHMFVVSATDQAGNTGNASWAWTIQSGSSPTSIRAWVKAGSEPTRATARRGDQPARARHSFARIAYTSSLCHSPLTNSFSTKCASRRMPSFPSTRADAALRASTLPNTRCSPRSSNAIRRSTREASVA